jgi:peptide/nickel transport system permease protein
MRRLDYGMIRYVLWRLAGLVAALIFAAFLLAVVLGAPSPIAAFGSLLIFDFGSSAPTMGARLAVTLPLALMATALAFAVGVPLGVIAARAPGSLASRIIGIATRTVMALPAVWIAMLLVVIVAGSLRWLPPGGFLPWEQSFGGAFASLILPTFALALPLSAAVAATTGRSLAGLARSAAVLGARAWGETMQRALFRIGVRTAAPPLLDLAGRGFGIVLAGSLIVETVFYLPGLGRLLFDAAAVHDLATVRATLFTVIALGALARFLCGALERGADARVTAVPA